MQVEITCKVNLIYLFTIFRSTAILLYISMLWAENNKQNVLQGEDW